MRAAVALIAFLACVVGSSTPDARACAIFGAASSAGAAPPELPVLARERVFIVWDRDTQMEDFVREARFDRANRTFGFVVPVPSTATVSPVAGDPFPRLEERYPFGEQPPRDAPQPRGPIAAAAEPPPPPVVVESRQRVGRFTAFVLSAMDGGGLSAWLKGNGLVLTREAQPWLDHFVRLRFQFVALRYDGPRDASGAAGMTSETVRIRFRTPNPYYPYLEPRGAESPAAFGRELSVWLVTRELMLPVAAVRDCDACVGYSWSRPWRDGETYAVSAESMRDVAPALASLLPGGSLVMQRFRDTKSTREGWGDALLVPTMGDPLDDAAIADRWPLLPVIDPRLEGDLDEGPMAATVAFADLGRDASIVNEPVEASAAPTSSAAASEPATSTSSCAIGGTKRVGTWTPWILVAAAALRRRTGRQGGLLYGHDAESAWILRTRPGHGEVERRDARRVVRRTWRAISRGARCRMRVPRGRRDV